MAKIIEWTDEQRAEWDAWVASRPLVVQDMARRLPPDRLYRMASTGHRVTLYSFSEDGTVTVNVGGDFNAVVFERRVFGVSPDDLTECDLPGPDDPCGSLLTDEADVGDYIESVRADRRQEGEG